MESRKQELQRALPMLEAQISELLLTIKSIKDEITEIDKDKRVDFGKRVLITDMSDEFDEQEENFSDECYIGVEHAKDSKDVGKVIIASPGFRFEIYENYHLNQNAISLHKIK